MLGRARNPFGFWDDYSLFRNLSALKTDPVSLGVALRRADQGVVAFGRAMGASYSTWLANVYLHDIGRDKKGISSSRRQ